jgi:hypothetical protein
LPSTGKPFGFTTGNIWTDFGTRSILMLILLTIRELKNTPFGSLNLVADRKGNSITSQGDSQVATQMPVYFRELLTTLVDSMDAEPPLMNSLFAIAPYKFEGLWVFDDSNAGLAKEPFISGADRILDVITQNIPDADKGFRLIFSSEPFPGYTARFVWSRPEHGGNWYFWPDKEMEGWLCPALFKYFEQAPENLYVKVC